MHRIPKTAVKCLLIVFLTMFLCSHPALAQESYQADTDPAAMIMDLLLARPAGLGALIVGTVFFAVSSPFSALGGNINEAYESLIVAPAEYTFDRPLGHFDND